VAEGAELENGKLAGVVLEASTPGVMPAVIWRAFAKRPRIVDSRRVSAWCSDEDVVIRGDAGLDVPVQVDGDYIGEFDEARFSVAPRSLTVVS
jgi:diacylglycerol kinase family enzyme